MACGRLKKGPREDSRGVCRAREHSRRANDQRRRIGWGGKLGREKRRNCGVRTRWGWLASCYNRRENLGLAVLQY